MKRVEYSDIVFLEKMNEIKATIRNSGFRLDYRKAYDVDLKMRSLIEQLYNPDCKDQSLAQLYEHLDMSIDRKATYTLTYYYFAMYHDNLELLDRMMREDVGLFDDDDRFCFELLDREFTKYFTEDQYLFLVRNCRDELMSFYHQVFMRVPNKKENEERQALMRELNQISAKLYSTEKELSIRGKNEYEKKLEEVSEELKSFYKFKYTDEERRDYCQKFASIMTLNPFVAKEENNQKDYHNLLTPAVFDLFSVQEIVNMSDTMKKYISDYASSPTILERLKSLFQKYPDYSSSLKLNYDLLSIFTDDELYHFPQEDIPFYEKASVEGIVTRYHDVEKKNQSLKKYLGFVNRSVFDAFSNEEIERLSDRAVGKISHLVLGARIINEEDRFKLQRSSIRIMKIDQFIQKVKKILR